MNILDVILLVLLGAFILFGFWFGFIHTLGSLIGAFIGTAVAGLFSGFVGVWLGSIFGNPELMKIIAFLVIFFIIARLIGFGFYLLGKGFNLLTRLPFLKSIDRLLGGILGFFEGLLVIGISLFLITTYQLNPTFQELFANSRFVPWFIQVSTVLQPLLPDAFRKVKSYINL